jgi:hypothetical protein
MADIPRRITGALIDLDDTLYRSERITTLVKKHIRGTESQASVVAVALLT